MSTTSKLGADMTDDDILRLAAQVLGNPLLFEDLKQDFTVHTEAGEWIKFARAILARQPAAIDKEAVSSTGSLDEVKPVVDGWIQQRGTSMDGQSYIAALQLAAYVKAALDAAPLANEESKPDGAPDPSDIQGWSVTINVNAQDILTIADNCLSGIDNIEDFAPVVRNCAEHLLSFLGDACDARLALIKRLKQFRRTRHGESIWLGDGLHNPISVDEIIAALLDREASKPAVQRLETTSENIARDIREGRLLVAMLHEKRPAQEIEQQIGDNRTALQAFAVAAPPAQIADVAQGAGAVDGWESIRVKNFLPFVEAIERAI